MYRCLSVWLAVTTAAALITAWLAPDLSAALAARQGEGGLAEQPFERLVAWLAAGSLVGCVAWGWAATSIVIAQTFLGRPTTNTRSVPGWLRTTVLVACGLAVLGATSAAHADEDTARARSDQRHVLAGLPSPDRVVGSVLPVPARHQPGIHVVRPGDTLWDIAEADLGGRADDGVVTAHWHRIHALNLAVIGADPDLILPGQELRLPTQQLDR